MTHCNWLKLALFLFVFGWLTSACRGPEPQAVAERGHYELSIQDATMRDLVRQYVAAQHLPARKSVVILGRQHDDYNINYYVSHTRQDVFRGRKQPMGYAFVDSTLVLVYAANYLFQLPPHLEEEIARTLTRRGIVLQARGGLEPETGWHFRQCADGGQPVKVEAGALAMGGIPCGYVLEPDTTGQPHLRELKP